MSLSLLYFFKIFSRIFVLTNDFLTDNIRHQYKIIILGFIKKISSRIIKLFGMAIKEIMTSRS